jgi:hypothetical protein
MPIPSRFRLTPASKALVREMCRLCTEIEHALETGDDPSELLDAWHQHSARKYEPVEFTTYWKAIDQEEFVREALNPAPRFVDDLQYAEAAAVVDTFVSGELPDSVHGYIHEWLDVQFPHANMSDLIHWPDEWFDDPTPIRDPKSGAFRPEAELSTDQILGYAMAKSGRRLPGSPTDVVLPFPLPTKW